MQNQSVERSTVASVPLVTFAVPAYNHARYIEQCLDKIVEEPYLNKELIIIDDGSTDNTAEVIRSWINKVNPKFPVEFVSRPNKGLSRTLNELISKSKGEYFRSCSSDDYLLPGTLSEMIDFMSKNPSRRMIFGDAVVIDSDGNKTHDSAIFQLYRGRKKNYFSEDGLREEVVRRWSLAGPVQLIRLCMYDEIGLYNENIKVEDWDMMLRMVSRHDYVAFFPKPVAAYRLHSSNSFNGISRKDPVGSAREYCDVLEKNHVLFHGKHGRELRYRLYKQRSILNFLEHGQKPSKIDMLVIRLWSRLRSLISVAQ